MTNPAQIYVAKETHEELHAALDAISNREREYLLYRFGFEDNIEHPLTETAEHFFLSESRVQIAAYYGRFCGAKRPQCEAERPGFLLI